MTRTVMQTLDNVINFVILFVIAGGGMMFHLLTVFAVKGVYGIFWAIFALILPGIAEIAYAFLQFFDGSPKYSILLGAFICLSCCGGAIWYGKYFVKRRVVRSCRQELATES